MKAAAGDISTDVNRTEYVRCALAPTYRWYLGSDLPGRRLSRHCLPGSSQVVEASAPCCVRHSATRSSSTRSCRPTPSNGPNGPARPDPSRGAYGPPSNSGAFLDTASQHQLFAFYRVAADTGARRGKLLNLRWHDIDLDHGEVRIIGSTAVITGQRIEGTTKSGRSRIVNIDPGTVQVLREHRKYPD